MLLSVLLGKLCALIVTSTQRPKFDVPEVQVIIAEIEYAS